jgi:hypothetical protein
MVPMPCIYLPDIFRPIAKGLPFALGPERTKEDHALCNTTIFVNSQVGPSYQILEYG